MPIRSVYGSSPLTRGKPDPPGGGRRRCGLIPAHAGKTCSGTFLSTRPRAHPRSRGENSGSRFRRSRRRGSSPLTRGKRFGWPAASVGWGLIPAHAGKTFSTRWASWPTWAHPRSRGENPWPPPGRLRAGGSSPLTRGKRASQRAWIVETGLIPAHAGKTPHIVEQQSPEAAHPRSRGENWISPSSYRPVRGSSPLTRGKHDVGWKVFVLDPAHPRSRGENHPLRPVPGRYHGSSPLTRGKRSCALSERGRVRLIPAHAGKTGACSRS